MNLPKNKNGKLYLINKEGKEVEFVHAIDVQEALFGVFGKDDKDENFESEYSLPQDFDMKIKLNKNTGNTKEEMMERQIRKGRPPKNQGPLSDSVTKKETEIADEGKKEDDKKE